MAGYELIDGYLIGLRRRLLWSPDVDDVMAEAEDHLMSAVERLMADGASEMSAQQTVLSSFGDSTEVAAAHAATSGKGVAMPTRFTKWAGVGAIVAAVLWTATAVLWLVEQFVVTSGGTDWAFGYGALATLTAAAALTVFVVVGLHRRHGGLGLIGAIGLAMIGLATVATIMFWFVMGWGVLLALGMLLVALAVRARHLAPKAATMLFGGAWLVGVSTWSVLRLLEVGTRDRWGDYPIVSPIAITVGVVILVPGLVGLGRWLSSETPTDLDSPESLAPA